MTVIFSALIIICGLGSAYCFIVGNSIGGIVNLAIVILSIIALIGRAMQDSGMLNSILNSKKTNDTNNQSNSTDFIPKSVSTNSNADEIKKYKELFDQGIISEEEYEAKKKQLLGL